MLRDKKAIRQYMPEVQERLHVYGQLCACFEHNQDDMDVHAAAQLLVNILEQMSAAGELEAAAAASAEAGSNFNIRHLDGTSVMATVLDHAAYDPEGTRLKN